MRSSFPFFFLPSCLRSQVHFGAICVAVTMVGANDNLPSKVGDKFSTFLIWGFCLLFRAIQNSSDSSFCWVSPLVRFVLLCCSEWHLRLSLLLVASSLCIISLWSVTMCHYHGWEVILHLVHLQGWVDSVNMDTGALNLSWLWIFLVVASARLIHWFTKFSNQATESTSQQHGWFNFFVGWWQSC